MASQVVPYNSSESKKRQVAKMFDNIASKYDLLNDLLSFGIENLWKKQLIKQLQAFKPQIILDVATGTGDLILYLSRLNPKKIIGIDISDNMLKIARQKIKRKLKNSAIDVEFALQDSENMQYPDGSFDLVTCAFGVRNFENLQQGLREMHRVLRNSGLLAILEFSKSRSPIFSKIFNFYFEKFLPYFGGIIAKDLKAYKYLPKSVKQFPEPEQFVNIVENCGFKTIKIKPLTFGIVTIYIFKKITTPLLRF